jgi:hypothetical protein
MSSSVPIQPIAEDVYAAPQLSPEAMASAAEAGMPPLMFAGLVVFMLIGYPVSRWRLAFSSASSPTNCCWRSRSSPSWARSSSAAACRGHAGFDGPAVRPMRGGLGYSVIIVGFILGAITGTVAAQVIAMALISMPVMMRYGYNMRYITGVLAASGTITQLVPPSLVLIVLADQLGKLGRRHVSRRLGPVADPDRAVRPLHVHPRIIKPQDTCRRCRSRRAR